MIIKFEFSIGTHYVGSTHRDVVEIDVDDEATDEEIEAEAEKCWSEWIWNYLYGGCKRLG